MQFKTSGISWTSFDFLLLTQDKVQYNISCAAEE